MRERESCFHEMLGSRRGRLGGLAHAPAPNCGFLRGFRTEPPLRTPRWLLQRGSVITKGLVCSASPMTTRGTLVGRQPGGGVRCW